MKVFYAPFLALVLVGCTHYTLSKEECATADWRALGAQEGALGYASEARLAKHEQACSRHQLPIQRTQYLAGWENGIEQYCKPEKAYEAGLRGEVYKKVCPPRLEDAFVAEFNKGMRIYNARSKHRRMIDESHRLRTKLEEARLTLAKATTPKERENATANINSIEREKEDNDRQLRLFENKHVDSLVD